MCLANFKYDQLSFFVLPNVANKIQILNIRKKLF